MNIKTGIGYDAHRLAEGEKLIIGGVLIPFEYGLLGHSDADVLIHAVMDALLGAAGLDDIGVYFPVLDAQYKDISSVILLQEVRRLIEEKGFTISNIDCVIIAERPKLRPYIPEMRRIMAAALSIDLSDINIKATTEEGLGFTGSGCGIAAKAVCLIYRTPGGRFVKFYEGCNTRH